VTRTGRTLRETRKRHVGFSWRNSEFARFPELLPSAGFAAAAGAGAASAFFTTLRPWLLGLSVVLIGLGFWQQRRATQCAVKGRVVGQVLLWAAVVVVLGMILLPQQIAGFLADRFSETGK